ncbi:unnamed protein product [Ilex paraguariensis]|uniref:Uncharacterized protein n=1 Tax=Ilex paraguariensis TaxID=185542 RepID=A0ABC8UDU5_9AQUA
MERSEKPKGGSTSKEGNNGGSNSAKGIGRIAIDAARQAGDASGGEKMLGVLCVLVGAHGAGSSDTSGAGLGGPFALTWVTSLTRQMGMRTTGGDGFIGPRASSRSGNNSRKTLCVGGDVSRRKVYTLEGSGARGKGAMPWMLGAVLGPGQGDVSGHAATDDEDGIGDTLSNASGTDDMLGGTPSFGDAASASVDKRRVLGSDLGK